MRFEDKVIAVTGAGTGIGLAAALAFGREGGKVAVVDHNPELGEAAARELEQCNCEVAFIQADVSDQQAVDRMIAAIKSTWGRLDVFVNNAGIYIQGDATQTAPEDWQRILAVNLTGAFLCTRAAVPLLLSSGGGVIVNVASEAGLVGIAGQVAYNVSKAGLIGLTRSCAVDLAARGIRVNAVCPGTTETPLVQAALQRAADPAAARYRLESSRPLNRLGRPEEIASAILYMACDEAGYATGSILSIDGGYTTQ
jgi:NAD(P)-dependent dehydrogenase (short-subunit alcohol dehydrogenase family)